MLAGSRNILQELRLKVRELQRQNESMERLEGYYLSTEPYLRPERECSCALLLSLVKPVEARELFAEGHAERVRYYAVMLGKELGIARRGLELLEIAAIVHDIGKIKIPKEILNKPGRLSGQEFNLIKSHPDDGADVLKHFNFLTDVVEIVRQHHEKFNGKGYPRGLGGEEISLEARMLTVVDIYVALGTERPYRNKMPMDQARAVLEEESRVGFLDRQIVIPFLDMFRRGDII